MHILLLAPGTSIHSERFLQMLLDRGHAVTFLSDHNPRRDGTDGYTFIPLAPYVRGLHRLGDRAAMQLESWIRVPHMKLIWSRIKPDLVNVHYVDRRAAYCARARLRPLVLTCWGSDINGLSATNRPGRQEQIASALEAADHITADARGVIDRCEQIVGHTLAATLWNFGVDTERFKPGFAREAQVLRNQLRISSRSKVILSSRRLHRHLGQEHILQAFSDVVRNPQMPETVLVFKRYLAKGETEDALRAQTKRMGVEDKVRWLDASSYDDVPVQYAMADIVVNYPEGDALPVSLLEAVACKRPLISSALPAYEVFPEESFLRVSSADPRALAAALETCLTEEPQKAQRRIEKAYATVREIGDQRKNMETMTTIFETVLVRQRSRATRQVSATH